MSHEITRVSERPEIRRAKLVTGKIEKKFRKQRFQCLYPGCTQPAILSHSQQKEGQLRAIAENGLVYALERNLFQNIKSMLAGQGNWVALAKKGIREASAFVGYCSQHDQMMFAPIEKQELIPDSPLHAALLFLRAMSFEYATKRKAAFQLDKILKIVGKDENPNWEGSNTWLQGVKLFLDREGPFLLDQIFDTIIKKDYNSLHTSWVRFTQTLPISVTTSVCPWLNDYYAKSSSEKPQAMVSFSIIPASGHTDVVCSWLDYCHEDSLWIQKEMETPKGVERIVNLLGIAESEDLCINIGFWESLPKDIKELVFSNMHHDAFRGPITDVPLIVKMK
jgi:hypothetical protein